MSVALIFPFLRENVNLPKKFEKNHIYFFTCQTIKTLVAGICVFGGFKNIFLSNLFGRLTFSRKNVNLPNENDKDFSPDFFLKSQIRI